MKVLIVGPITSPIVRRLEFNLRNSGLDVYVASHNVGEFAAFNVIDLGPLNSFFSYFHFFKINRLVKSLQPDLVHAHVLNHYGLMCAFQSKPLVVALWGSEVILAPITGGLIKRMVIKLINEFIVFRSDVIHSSSQHVIDEAVCIQQSAKEKSEAFYWGFPLKPVLSDEVDRINLRLYEEFGFDGAGFIVFPRGVSEIYNPRLAVKIIKGLLRHGVRKKIIIFKGFANEVEDVEFKAMISKLDVFYIDRLLDESELYSIYSRSLFHFSIPISDSLGGGVIEPAQLGSIPILNDIPPYQEYLKENRGILINDFSDKSILDLANLIMSVSINNKKEINTRYTLSSVVSSFKSLYGRALQKSYE